MKKENILIRVGRALVVPKLPLVLTVGSGVCFIFSMITPSFLPFIAFVPELVLQGEIWRLASFIFYPFAMHPIFAVFTYYLFFIMGSALEIEWGREKFNLFVFLAYFLTILFSFVTPNYVATNYYIYLMVYLAFAALHPDFVLYLFFAIPVKMKWLAWVVVALTALEFIASGLASKLSMLAAFITFMSFFGPNFVRQSQGKVQTMKYEVKVAQEELKPFHTCFVCGITEKTNPQTIFRVSGGHEYCREHLPIV